MINKLRARQTFRLGLLCLLSASVVHTASSKRTIHSIIINGDNLLSSIEIHEKNIIGQFNIFNGPGVRVTYGDGKPLDLSRSRDPQHAKGRFIDWPRGIARERPNGLQRLEVAFRLGDPSEQNNHVVAYEIDSAREIGFIYLPRWKNGNIHHGVEGNWFYATQNWNKSIMPIIAGASEQGSVASGYTKLSCTVGTASIEMDGTVNLRLLDEHGVKRGQFRYSSDFEQYESVRKHIGLSKGKEGLVSCWPQR